MYPGTSVVPSRNFSFQLLPLESSAWALPEAQFELTITAPFDVRIVSLLPAKVRAPHLAGSVATSP